LSGRLIVSVAPQAGARHRRRDLAWASILLGCDVSFIFKTNENLEAGALAFSALHPACMRRSYRRHATIVPCGKTPSA
jgi:hypothetical protein